MACPVPFNGNILSSFFLNGSRIFSRVGSTSFSFRFFAEANKKKDGWNSSSSDD
jgi:hypothetical protein